MQAACDENPSGRPLALERCALAVRDQLAALVVGAVGERHDALVRAAIHDHDGHVVKTMGDAFHAVFVRAPDAVTAALEAQRRLQAGPWGEIGPIRVRMAVHTGAAEERDGDYYGRAVNLAARVGARAAGGEVLVTRPLVDAAGRHLEFERIGAVKLKGFSESTELFLARLAEEGS